MEQQKKELVVKIPSDWQSESSASCSAGQAMEHSEVFPCRCAKDCVCLMYFFAQECSSKGWLLLWLKPYYLLMSLVAGFLSKLMGICGCYKYSKGSMDTLKNIQPTPQALGVGSWFGQKHNFWWAEEVTQHESLKKAPLGSSDKAKVRAAKQLCQMPNGHVLGCGWATCYGWETISSSKTEEWVSREKDCYSRNGEWMITHISGQVNEG